jgi:hypothetical protein
MQTRKSHSSPNDILFSEEPESLQQAFGHLEVDSGYNDQNMPSDALESCDVLYEEVKNDGDDDNQMNGIEEMLALSMLEADDEQLQPNS